MRCWMRGRVRGSGGEATTGVRRAESTSPRSSIGEPRPSRTRPSSPSPTGALSAAGGGHGIAGADAVHLAQRHQQRAARAEAHDLGEDRGGPAADLDLADLADLGLEAGGLDDEADQVGDAAAAAVQVGTEDRVDGAAERALVQLQRVGLSGR
jgi:hypothetical protein